MSSHGTDKELADKIVALGVGVLEQCYYDFQTPLGIDSLSAKHFVRDWRVAGALMEKLAWHQLYFLFKPYRVLVDTVCPRHICATCEEALTQAQQGRSDG